MSYLKELAKLLEAMGNPKVNLPPPPEVPKPERTPLPFIIASHPVLSDPVPPEGSKLVAEIHYGAVWLTPKGQEVLRSLMREELTRWFGPPPQE